MALIKCSECGNIISDRAVACPGCGAPLGNGAAATSPSRLAVTNSVRVKRAGLKWEAIGFVVILVAIVAGIAGAGGLAWMLGFIGFVVFIIGRFID
jgi:uncharacterized membrane protein YvbJ